MARLGTNLSAGQASDRKWVDGLMDFQKVVCFQRLTPSSPWWRPPRGAGWAPPARRRTRPGSGPCPRRAGTLPARAWNPYRQLDEGQELGERRERERDTEWSNQCTVVRDAAGTSIQYWYSSWLWLKKLVQKNLHSAAWPADGWTVEALVGLSEVSPPCNDMDTVPPCVLIRLDDWWKRSHIHGFFFFCLLDHVTVDLESTPAINTNQDTKSLWWLKNTNVELESSPQKAYHYFYNNHCYFHTPL